MPASNIGVDNNLKATVERGRRLEDRVQVQNIVTAEVIKKEKESA